METLDLVGHAGYVLLVGGQFLVARRMSIGWAARVGGDLVWVVLGFILGLSSIVAWSAVFVAVDSWGWWKWRRSVWSQWFAQEAGV